jgi:hypothetical protein
LGCLLQAGLARLQKPFSLLLGALLELAQKALPSFGKMLFGLPGPLLELVAQALLRGEGRRLDGRGLGAPVGLLDPLRGHLELLT